MKSWLLSAGCAIVTAVLLVLSLPPMDLWPLGWVALAPLFRASAGKGFFMGFLSGIGSSLLVAWLAVSGHLYPDPSVAGEPTWTYLGCAIFGFVLAVSCGIAGEIKVFSWRSIVGIAAFAVLLEFVLMPVLPATIALTQARVPGMLSLASYTGIWGVAFAVWALNIWLATRLASNPKRPWPVVAVVVLILVGYLPHPERSGQSLRVSVVQSDSDDLGQLERLSKAGNPELAVWPEFGGMPFVQRGDTSRLVALASKPGMPALVTSFPDHIEPMPRNSAALFSASGESERYYKRRLFGGEKSMHRPGTEAIAVSFAKPEPSPARDVVVGLNICFDSCFPSLIRETVTSRDAGLVALPTIDPESPHGFLAAMHAAFTPFRAAELGVAIARADAFAHSMIVSNTGRIVGELPTIGDAALVRTVDVLPRMTVYKVLGDWFLAALALTLLVLVASWLTKRGPPEPLV